MPLETLDFPDFVTLLTMSHFVVTDSDEVQEEAPALGTPVLVARYATERGEDIAERDARLIGTRSQTVISEMTRLLDYRDWHGQWRGGAVFTAMDGLPRELSSDWLEKKPLDRK